VQRLKANIDKLDHIQATCDVLRHCNRVTRGMKQLRKHMSNISADNLQSLSKAAQSLHDVSSVLDDPRSGLQDLIIAAEVRPKLTEYGDIIRKASRKALHEGITALSQSEVGEALQVFYNLKQLPQEVFAALQKVESSFVVQTRVMLDVSNLTQQLQAKAQKRSATAATAPASKVDAGSGDSSLRSEWWMRVAKFADDLNSHVQQVWTAFAALKFPGSAQWEDEEKRYFLTGGDARYATQ